MEEHGLTGEIVVTWPGYDVDGPTSGRLLRDMGLSIRLEPKTGARTSAEVIALVGDAVGVIASNDPFTADAFDGCPNLKVIARTGVGVDTIDVPAATRAGVLIATAPGTNEETVADHTLALMLALVRRLVEHDRSLRDHRWDRAGSITPNDMVGATVGVIGSGAIGRAVIHRVLAFRSRVLVYDPAVTVPPEHTELVALDELLSQSDVVTLHVPLLDQTRGLIGARELALMRPTAILVNASRGGVVDETALANALRSGRVAAAGLDVFADEPPFHSELLDLPNVLVTPHVAGISHRSIAAMNEVATRAVIAVLSGEVPPNVVNSVAP